MSAASLSQDNCSLCDLPEGSTLRVEKLEGPPAECSRLYALGILPGTRMELRQRCGTNGSVCVHVRQSQLVLGEGMARCVFCCRSSPERSQ